MGFWALCFNSRVLPQSLSFCWRSGWRCYPHFSLHTLVATVVAYSSHNLVCRDMVMSMQWGYITIFCPPARVNPLARATLPPCKQDLEIKQSLQIPSCWKVLGETHAFQRPIESSIDRYIKKWDRRRHVVCLWHWMRKKKMVRVSAFILLIVLLSLLQSERSSGLPTKTPSFGELC